LGTFQASTYVRMLDWEQHEALLVLHEQRLRLKLAPELHLLELANERLFLAVLASDDRTPPMLLKKKVYRVDRIDAIYSVNLHDA
jgi:hypothetical protein